MALFYAAADTLCEFSEYSGCAQGG